MDYQKKNASHINDMQQFAEEHVHKIIEESFAKFETNHTVSEEEMRKEFGKYGWGYIKGCLSTKWKIRFNHFALIFMSTYLVYNIVEEY